MSILPPRPASGTARFADPPWADDDPRRLQDGRTLPPGHLARRIDDGVARLDLGPLWAAYAGVGSRPHRPDLLLRAALYEARCGRHSPAAWHRNAAELVPLRWLLRGCRPSRSCWYAFRDRLGPRLDALLAQVLGAAVAEGHTPAERAAVDGTLVAADASRHRLLNDDALQKRIAQLDAAVAADDHPAAPGAGPAAPAPEEGAPRPGDERAAAGPAAAAPAGWVGRSARGRQRQQRRLRQARERMDGLQRRNRAKRASKRKPAAAVVLSPADPEAVVGRDKEGVFRPLYNVQFADDLDSPFVLAYDVFARQNDAGLLGPMLGRAAALTGRPLRVALADTAYAGGADLAAAAAAGAAVYAPLPKDPAAPKQIPKSAFRWLPQEQTYECPQGHRLAYAGAVRQKQSSTEDGLLWRYRCPPAHCAGCPRRGECTPNPGAGRTVSRAEHEDLVEALRARMATAEAKALYRLRGRTVELANADVKGHRGLRRMSGRGLARARAQVGLVVLVHDLLTLEAERSKARGPGRVSLPVVTSPAESVA